MSIAKRWSSLEKVAGLALMALALSCGGAQRRPQNGSEVALRYRVRTADPSQSLEVQVCFEGRVPARLRPGMGDAIAFLRSATHRGLSLRVADSAIWLAGVETGECIEYVVDVARAIASGSFRSAVPLDDATLVSSSVWLYRPMPRPEALDATLIAELPEGIALSTAWEREGDGYRLDDTAFEFLCHTVFGRFERYRFDVDGASVEIARTAGPLTAQREDLEAWASAAIGAVRRVSGEFPTERVQLVMIPTEGRADEPVAFGFVGRGGGGSVLLLPREGATREALERDWVLVHELSHLLHPYVAREDSWLSEGIATYYQEVLRARSGLQTASDAWRAIELGIARGKRQETGRSLREDSARMHETHVYQRVYWGGTAIALLIDVSLRRQGSSLDEALAHLATCCAREPRAYTAAEIVQEMARAAHDPELPALVRRALDATTLPDVDATFARLGVRVTPEGVELVDAEESAIRDAIVAP